MNDVAGSADEAGGADTSAKSGESRLGRRVLFLVIGVVVLVTAYFVGGAVLPRWWAQRVSNVIDGRLIFGNTLGFVSGFLFTLLPIFVLALGWRFKKSWRRALVFLVAAFIVAAPNLLTLGIVIGDGNAAHAGERILDVDGPGFRGGSLVGVVVGVMVSSVLLWLVGSRGRNKRKASELQDELNSRS